MTDLERMVNDITNRKKEHVKRLKDEICELEIKYDTWIMEIIEHELDKPIIREMTIDQIIEEYGDVLTDEEIKIIKSW